MEKEVEQKVSLAEKISQWHKQHRENNKQQEEWALRNWRAWGSWFSWGSPVGLGLCLISVGIFILLLHYAGLIGR